MVMETFSGMERIKKERVRQLDTRTIYLSGTPQGQQRGHRAKGSGTHDVENVKGHGLIGKI